MWLSVLLGKPAIKIDQQAKEKDKKAEPENWPQSDDGDSDPERVGPVELRGAVTWARVGPGEDAAGDPDGAE